MTWWCCSADFGEHTTDCKNYVRSLPDDYYRQLGERWAALKLPWMPGMLTCDGWRIDSILPDGRISCGRDDYGQETRLPPEQLGLVWPNFRDPATVGCLLPQMRKAWNDPGAHCVLVGRHWLPKSQYGKDLITARDWPTTEAEAMVAALEAAGSNHE